MSVAAPLPLHSLISKAFLCHTALLWSVCLDCFGTFTCPAAEVLVLQSPVARLTGGLCVWGRSLAGVALRGCTGDAGRIVW